MGHFYAQTESGIEPRHFVEMASRKGELRPTRITDVRKMWNAGEIVVPSVTTILNILDKPALKNWLIDQHLQQAWFAGPEPFSEYEYPDDYLREIKRLAEAEMSKAPDAGTDIHKLLEAYILGDRVPDEWRDLCHNVSWELECQTGVKNDDGVKRYYVEEYFVSDLGFGGCTDLRIEDQWVIDYKTKQTADKFKPGKMAYPDHARQLAAYRKGLGIPDARCANIFVCIETGEVDFHEHSEEELQTGWKVFEHSLAIWKLINGVEK